MHACLPELLKRRSTGFLNSAIERLLLEKQMKFDMKPVIFLENAYINARCLGFVYEKEDAEEAIKIAREVVSFVDRTGKEKGRDD